MDGEGGGWLQGTGGGGREDGGGREGRRVGGPRLKGGETKEHGERLVERPQQDAGRQQLAGGVKERDNFKECVCVCVLSNY